MKIVLGSTNEVYKFMQQNVAGIRPISKWMADGPLKVYLRAGPYHFAEGKLKLAVGVASISVPPKQRGKGLFKAFVLKLERQAKELGYKFVRFEEIVSEDLLRWLQAYGYKGPGIIHSTLVKELQ